MEKIIKRIGNSIGIIFDCEDREIYNLEKGKVVKLEIVEVRKLAQQNSTHLKR